MSSVEELLNILEGQEVNTEVFESDEELELDEPQVEDGTLEWAWSREGTRPSIAPFDSFISGFTNLNLTKDSRELEYFEYYADGALIAKIARCTNKYYQYYIRHVDIREHSRTREWHVFYN